METQALHPGIKFSIPYKNVVGLNELHAPGAFENLLLAACVSQGLVVVVQINLKAQRQGSIG